MFINGLLVVDGFVVRQEYIISIDAHQGIITLRDTRLITSPAIASALIRVISGQDKPRKHYVKG